jgi:hypothetical protein
MAASVSHACAGTTPESTRNDAARLKALALAGLVEHPAARRMAVDDLVAAAARVAPAPAPTLART